jgi:hypothetical protein
MLDDDAKAAVMDLMRAMARMVEIRENAAFLADIFGPVPEEQLEPLIRLARSYAPPKAREGA